jgi:RHH-type proline utilization regulon transcriptional repressor/proline dehydrogenase/delta 1-pyrroline-5-carboxylate dehydrogenase
MSHSYIKEAEGIIESVRGSPQSVQDRKEKAITLASLMLRAASECQTRPEKAIQKQLAAMMNDPAGKVFTADMTDQCFRSSKKSRVADQIVYLIDQFGIPKFLAFHKRIGFYSLKYLARLFPSLFVPMTTWMIRREMSNVILPGEESALKGHMKQRFDAGVRVNLNHLGEAILGEEEAKNRQAIYLDDLRKPEVEYISIKISTIYSQLNLLSWNDTVNILKERLKELYRTAQSHEFTRRDGSKVKKFVNLDMEEYRDLHLTVEVFKGVLDEPEFKNHSAGIVLQAYLPDSYEIQKSLTEWAMRRVSNGGAPIKIRIVKGANLAMEQYEASLRDWPQAPYMHKSETDANYKRMINYACTPEHARASNIGVASHNLFDIAYALLLRSENETENEITFEMLEGMADHMRRVVHSLAGDMLVYCPAATKEEFQNAVAYLIRRLDENTAPDNFLRHTFGLVPGTPEWDVQANRFRKACDESAWVSYNVRRMQDRNMEHQDLDPSSHFETEADTDFSLPQNRQWLWNVVAEWKSKKIDPIALVIGGEKIVNDSQLVAGSDPSRPGYVPYKMMFASMEQIEDALTCAYANQESWSATPIKERAKIFQRVASILRRRRGDLIGACMLDGGKLPAEADVEISEAIDFVEYYWRSMMEWGALPGLSFKGKGTVLITPPWNFPCAIPMGCVSAALIAGNCAIFKPAKEGALVGSILADILYEAGVPKGVLQFVLCEDDPQGSTLIRDSRISSVMLTGATSTAQLFLSMRPNLDLVAETGGKNAIIGTSLADRDLLIKDTVQSAFGHGGQKCSACSLLILEDELYEDKNFREQLKDAIESLKVGPAWNLSSKVNPLIMEPNPILLRALTKLDPGEEWLVQPKQDENIPNLWSPGVKFGVKPNSFSHRTEFFGPVLSVMRAKNLAEAVEIANATDYGLTSGFHSLDQREQDYWIDHIKAGNCYVNRGITGAIVERQPFGGCKESNFGRGSKAGGPNYLTQLMVPSEIESPRDRKAIEEKFSALKDLANALPSEDKEEWSTAAESYSFWFQKFFSVDHDPSQVRGQDNILRFVPHDRITFRVTEKDRLVDILKVCSAAAICHTPLELSCEGSLLKIFDMAKGDLERLKITLVEESELQFIDRIEFGSVDHVRSLSAPSNNVYRAFPESSARLRVEPVYNHGRIELLNYLREVSLSIDYHRYGNLGSRELEPRKALR